MNSKYKWRISIIKRKTLLKCNLLVSLLTKTSFPKWWKLPSNEQRKKEKKKKEDEVEKCRRIEIEQRKI